MLVPFNGQGNSRSGGESTDSGSAVNATISSKAEAPDSPVSRKPSADYQVIASQMATDASAPPPSQNLSAPKPSQEKVLPKTFSAFARKRK